MEQEKIEQNIKENENINELIKDDVFNLNSFNKEEYYVTNDKPNEKNETENKEKKLERSSSLRKRTIKSARSKSSSSKHSSRRTSSSLSHSRSTSSSSRDSSASTSSTNRSSSTTKQSEHADKGRKRSRSSRRSLSKRRRRRRTRTNTRSRSKSKQRDKSRRNRTKSRSRTRSKSKSRGKRGKRSYSNRFYRDSYASSSYNYRNRRSRNCSLNKRSYPTRRSPFDRYDRNETQSNRAGSYRSPLKPGDSKKHFNQNSNESEYNKDYYDYYHYYYYYYDYYYGNDENAKANRYNHDHERYSRTSDHLYDKDDKYASTYYEHYSNYPAHAAPPPPPPHDYPYTYPPYNADSNKIRTPPIPSPEQLEDNKINHQSQDLSNPALGCANEINQATSCLKMAMCNQLDEIRSPIKQCQEITSTNLSVTKPINDAEFSGVNSNDKQQNTSNTDDLNAFKTKLKMQLQEELFKEQEEQEKRAISDSSEFDESDKGQKKSKKHKEHHHHHNHHKHRHKHKSHKKSKKEQKRNRSDETDLPEEELLDEYKKLRRSDRIKTIENHKIQSKELAISKKLHKLSKSVSQSNLFDDNSLNDFDSPTSELANKSGDNSNENADFNLSAQANEEPTSAQDLQELAELYEHIDENLYVSVKRKKLIFNKEAKRMACDCSTSEQERAMGLVPCGDDCLNRMLMIECGARCPCGEYCTNRNFRNKTKAKIRPFKTHYKGWGLKANENLKG
jgi:hypothetical protein